MRFHPALFNQNLGGSDVSAYDLAIQDMGLMFYSNVTENSAIVWPTLTEVLAEDSKVEANRGAIWFDAWSVESGYLPETHQEAIEDSGYGLIWYSEVDTSSAITWPTYTTVLTDNLRLESENGKIWFDAWSNESGYLPAVYDTEILLANWGTLWFSTLIDVTPI